MADIELVIKIPEEIRLALINNVQLSMDQQSICDSYIKQAIINGTPLPKGHGRLIDADSLLEYGSCPNSCDGTATCMESYEHLHCPIRVFDIESINDAPTIIAADKEMKYADDN